MTQYKTVMVECRFTLPVEVPAEWDDETISFDIEENSCPGTSNVGAALSRLMEEHERNSTCWACAVNGENRIVRPSGV